MSDRIKNYQQEADQITTLKAIRTDLGVTPSSYTPDATVVTKDRVVTFAQAEEELVVLGDVERGVRNLTGDVNKNENDIANIKSLLQGHLYDYQTDSTSAYTKSVPAGAMPYAGIEKVGGKTIVFNQLVDTGTTTVSTISGHTYYTLINGTASIVTADGTAITIVDDTADMVCDLTLMFGMGNEPSTTADFTAIFGATHYAYNAGTLLSAGVTEVVSNGYNHLNETYMQQHFTYTDGVYEGAVNPFYYNYNDVFYQTWKPNTAYLLSADVQPKGSSMNLRWEVHYTDNTTNSSNAYADTTKFGTISITTDPTKTINYIKIALFNGGSLYIKNIIVREANPLQTISIHTAIRNLEGYGWSAGTAYNYVDFERKVFVKKVGKIEFNGNQNISQVNVAPLSNSVAWTYAQITNRQKHYGGDGQCNVVASERFIEKPYNYLISNNGDFICTMNPNYYSFTIRCTDTSLTTATAINAFLSANPITVYYELETPVEVDISEYLTDDNLIEVDAGGTLTFENQHGDDYRLPVPSEETYMIDLQSALGE